MGIRLTRSALGRAAELEITRVEIAKTIGQFERWESEPGLGYQAISGVLGGRQVRIVFLPVQDDIIVVGIQEVTQ